MGDSMRDDGTFNLFAPDDPPRDEALAALLRQAVGEVPASAVDWDALAARISRALPSRASAAWWSYTERWSRRILPIALAASLLGAVALWNADEPVGTVVAQAAPDIVADVVQGESVEDAARSFARTMTVDATLGDAEPE